MTVEPTTRSSTSLSNGTMYLHEVLYNKLNAILFIRHSFCYLLDYICLVSVY